MACRVILNAMTTPAMRCHECPAYAGRPPAGRGAAPAAVLRRRRQRAAGDGVVDVLADRRALASWLPCRSRDMPAGWLHAIVMQYQVLPSFMFGFLLTVFPRWMSLPALTRLALRAGRRRLVRRPGADACFGCSASRMCCCARPAADAGRLAGRLSCSWPCWSGATKTAPGMRISCVRRAAVGLIGLG